MSQPTLTHPSVKELLAARVDVYSTLNILASKALKVFAGPLAPGRSGCNQPIGVGICICMQVSLGEVPYIAADSDKIARQKATAPAMLSFVCNADRRRGRSAALFQPPLFC